MIPTYKKAPFPAPRSTTTGIPKNIEFMSAAPTCSPAPALKVPNVFKNAK